MPKWMPKIFEVPRGDESAQVLETFSVARMGFEPMTSSLKGLRR